MTDEQRPWEVWPEYRGMLDLVAVTGATKHAEVDALCARVWREARRDKADAHAALDAALDKATGDALDAERARADAAEAQRDRLAAALRDTLRQTCLFTEAQIEERIAGAALADVPDAEPSIRYPESDALAARNYERINDPRARRRDEAYRAMVEACDEVLRHTKPLDPEQWETLRHGYEGDIKATMPFAIVVQVDAALALARQVGEG